MNSQSLFNKFPQLETNRLRLDQITKTEGAALLRLYQNQELAQYNAWADIRTLKQAKQKIKQFDQEFKNCQKVRWGIYLKESSQLMGNCVLYHLNPNEQKAEIGFNLMPEFWHRGYMTEALISILEYLFLTIQMQEIEAWVMAKNENSQKFLEKIGFSHKTSTLRSRLSGADFQAFIIYSLGRQDWRKE